MRIPAALYNEATLRRASGISDWAPARLAVRRLLHPGCAATRSCVASAWDTARAGAAGRVHRDRAACARASRSLTRSSTASRRTSRSAMPTRCRAGSMTRARTSAEAFELVESRGAPDWVHANMLAVFAMAAPGEQRRRRGSSARRGGCRNAGAVSQPVGAGHGGIHASDGRSAMKTAKKRSSRSRARSSCARQAPSTRCSPPAQCQRGVLRLNAGRRRPMPSRDLRWGSSDRSRSPTPSRSARRRWRPWPPWRSAMPDQAARRGRHTRCRRDLQLRRLRLRIVRPGRASAPIGARVARTERFAAAHARGAAMTYDDAVAFVRAAFDRRRRRSRADD